MDKDILEQYLEIKGEIRDLKERIDRDQHRLERIKAEGVVSDTVRGTRKDGTIYFVFCDLLSSGCYNKAEGGIKVMDIRNTIINNVLLAVQSLLDDQQLQAVQDALYIQLNSYEVQERSTELRK